MSTGYSAGHSDRCRRTPRGGARTGSGRHRGQTSLRPTPPTGSADHAVRRAIPAGTKGEDGSGRAAFHVAGTAPVDAAVDQFGAPWVVRPAGAVAHRKAVDMAVEREVTPGPPRLEHRHDVRHHLVGCNH